MLLPVGVTSYSAGNYRFPFRHLVLGGEADIGVSSTVRRHVPFEALAPIHLLGNAGIVKEEVGSERFVHPSKVSPSEHLIEPPGDRGLVLFGYGTHPSPPPTGCRPLFAVTYGNFYWLSLPLVTP